MLRLYTFGGLRIEHKKERLRLPIQKARDLLAYLLTRSDRLSPRAVLTSVLWPNLPREKARHRLSDTLWRTRQILSEHIQADDEHIWLNADPHLWIDVDEFKVKTEANTPKRQLEAPTVQRLCEAIALYQGPFLHGFYQDWVLLEQEHLRGLFLQMLNRLLEHYKQIADYPAALRIARRIVTVEPLHEAAHRELIRLYHLLGRNAEAIAQYRHCQEILRDELNVLPAPETQALHQALSQHISPLPETHLPIAAIAHPSKLDNLPLVGRDAERAALLAHLEAAASERGDIVLLEGEPGIGKSRLARELMAGARWRHLKGTIARAEAQGSRSYGLLLQALRPLLTPLHLQQLARIMPAADRQALVPLIPTIAEGTPPPDLPPAQARERLQRALIELVINLGRIAPCLLVLEDIQHADAESLALLPRLLPHLRKSQVLILLTGRSAEIRTRTAVWQMLQELDRAGPFPRYTLDRLVKENIDHLMETLLKERGSDLSDYLTQESEGVPLYLVELLKMWRDEGKIQPDEHGAWHWMGTSAIDLPPDVGQSIIECRLSHLSPEGETLLSVAGIIGTEVVFNLLSHVCVAQATDVALATSDVCRLINDELLPLGFLVEEEGDYRFSHEQIRRAVRHRLSPSTRQRLHRQVALALEDLSPERFELLAHHFAASGQRRPAIHYLTLAAERARDLFAHQAALNCYNRLLDLLTYAEDRAARYDILHDRAEVLGWIADREAQGRDLEEMIELARALSDDARLAEALHLRSEWHRLQGRYESANEDTLAALDIYRALGDTHARANLLSQLGRNVIYTGDYRRAATYFREALSIYETLDDLDGQIGCLIGLAHVAEFRGDYMRNLSYCQQSLTLAKEAGDTRRTSHAYFAVGVTYYDLGNTNKAAVHFREALQLAEAIGDTRRQGVSHFYLGIVAIERDELKTARRHLNTARRLLREVQDISWEGSARAALGHLALLQNDPRAAKRELTVAYQRCLELGECSYAVVHLSYLALAELALGEREDAWETSQQAVAELETGLTGVEHPQRIHYNHYRVARATRHWAAARVALEQAAHIVVERAERIEDPTLKETYRTGRRANRAISEAVADLPPAGHLRVRLARCDTPTHRRPTRNETTMLVWTVDAGKEDTALAEREGKVALRRHRILRLLDEAQATGAVPTVADLAGALEVSSRTIRGDLATLRDQGHAARTRGRRAEKVSATSS